MYNYGNKINAGDFADILLYCQITIILSNF